MTAISAGAEAPRERLAFGHPRGLVVLAGTELWDRVSFHGMQSLLVLYLVEQLLLPGHVEHIVGFPAFRAAIEGVTGPLSVQALASQIFGLYVGLAYFTPVIGGVIGDRLMGRRNTVALGALSMTAGHFCMAFDQSFLLAMLLLVVGAGCLRGNLAPQLGALYAPDDRRRDTAFQVYGAAVNCGAFIAPLVTGALAQAFSWHVGFAFAGFGMLAGLVWYLAGQGDLAETRRVGAQPARRSALRAGDRRIIVLLLLLVPLAATFWIAQSQVWNTYNIWARDHLELRVGGWTLPVPWLQSMDGLAPFVELPLMLAFWRWQAARGVVSDDLSKAATGCFLFGVSTVWLALGGFVHDGAGKTPLLWAIAFHLGSNLGWLYFSPVMQSLFTRVAPQAVNATLVGVYYFSIFLGSTVSGRLGGLYETVSPVAFWGLHAAIVTGGGVLILALARVLRPAFAARLAAETGV